MLAFIQKAIVSPVVKPIAKAVTGFFTRKATAPAQAYAQQVAEKIVDRLPESLEIALAAYQTIQSGGLNVAYNGLAVAEIAVGGESKAKKLLFSPAELVHDYKNYQFLNGVVDGNYTQRDENFDEDMDFVVVEKAKTNRPTV